MIDKWDLILQEEKMHEQRVERALDYTTPGNQFNHPFQHENVEPGDDGTLLYNLNIAGSKAAVITKIGNEWYPNIELELIIDGNKRSIEREVAPTEDPLETKIVAREQIEWRAKSDADEEYVIGVLTDGHYVPVRMYDELSRHVGGGI